MIKRERELCKVLLDMFGTLAVVIKFRSTKYGSEFDKTMFKVLLEKINLNYKATSHFNTI